MPRWFSRVAVVAAYDSWRRDTVFGAETLFGAARAAGLATALVGQPDFHAFHISTADIDVQTATAVAGAAAAVSEQLARTPRALIVVALGGGRLPARHSPRALPEL